MPVPGVPESEKRGKAVVADAIRATFPAELSPKREGDFRYILEPRDVGGPGVDVLYRPYNPSVRIRYPVTRRPVKTYVRGFPEVQVLVCDEDFREAAGRLIAYLNGLEGVSAEEIQRVPYWCNWGQGDRKPGPYLD